MKSEVCYPGIWNKPYQLKVIYIIQGMFWDHNGIKVEINNKVKGKYSNI